MPKTVKALVITGPSTSEWAFRDVPTDLDSLQAIVGGSIECLSFAGLELICNEEGKNEGLPLTVALCERDGAEVILHDIIAGPLIVHGSIDNRNEGAMLGLSPLQEAALKYWRDLDWRIGLRIGLAVTVDGPFIRPNMPW